MESQTNLNVAKYSFKIQIPEYLTLDSNGLNSTLTTRITLLKEFSNTNDANNPDKELCYVHFFETNLSPPTTALSHATSCPCLGPFTILWIQLKAAVLGRTP